MPSVMQQPIPTLPPKERLILDLLIAQGPLFGLQLVALSEGMLKRGTVYVTLGRMETKGFVRSEQEAMPPGAIGLPRRLYYPTPLGERVVRAWSLMAREFVEGSPDVLASANGLGELAEALPARRRPAKPSTK
jgi:DNA-binding PadR family transcriptional regulator